MIQIMPMLSADPDIHPKNDQDPVFTPGIDVVADGWPVMHVYFSDQKSMSLYQCRRYAEKVLSSPALISGICDALTEAVESLGGVTMTTRQVTLKE